MALPKIVQKLFSDEGKGSKLRPDIVPTTINGNSPDPEGNFTPDQTGCLPKTGGTMTGNIIFSSTIGSAYMEYQGANGNFAVSGAPWDKGARLSLFGEGDAVNGGKFLIGAMASGKSAWLEGNPNGNLYWNGNNVITSAGGNFNNAVYFNSRGHIRFWNGSDFKYTALYGYGAKAGGFEAFDEDSPGNPSGFNCRARGANGEFYDLSGRRDGSLIWKGNSVITSAGGTMTGQLVSSVVHLIKRNTNDEYLMISGGKEWGDGGVFEVFGKNHEQGGAFKIWANNDTSNCSLDGFPDGTLRWGGKNVVCVESWTDWGDKGYRIYSDGFIEQWGRTWSSGRATTAVTLHTPMRSNSYNITISQGGASDTWSTYASNATTTGFTLKNDYGSGTWWHVCGY